jgi:hypothetical protein
VTNREAAELAVEALRASGRLEDLDEPLATAVLALASAVDEGGDDKLWREYRAFVQALREVALGGSDDDTTEFIFSVQTPGRAKVGNAKNAKSGVVRAGDRGGRGADGDSADAVATPGRRGGRRARS